MQSNSTLVIIAVVVVAFLAFLWLGTKGFDYLGKDGEPQPEEVQSP